MTPLRVATTQFNTGNNVQQNLDKFLSYIDEGAAGGARLAIGPEFGNHTSFYDDRDHAWAIAVDPDGEYVKAIRERARTRQIFVVFNATCRDGAQLITNSHNSCALDEPYLHIPVRAAENRAWVMASGKTGNICVEEMVAPLTEDVGIPRHLLIALGENPILDPNGREVAKLSCQKEGIVVDIDLAIADDKSWQDGDLIDDRRPELYTAVGEPPGAFPDMQALPFHASIVNVRCDRHFEEDCNRALDLLVDAVDNGSHLIVLPELCTLDRDDIAENPDLAVERSVKFEEALASHCRELGVYAATSLVTESAGHRFHTGILLNAQGQRTIAYHQTHLRHRYRHWCTPGDELEVFDTPWVVWP